MKWASCDFAKLLVQTNHVASSAIHHNAQHSLFRWRWHVSTNLSGIPRINACWRIGTKIRWLRVRNQWDLRTSTLLQVEHSGGRNAKSLKNASNGSTNGPRKMIFKSEAHLGSQSVWSPNANQNCTSAAFEWSQKMWSLTSPQHTSLLLKSHPSETYHRSRPLWRTKAVASSWAWLCSWRIISGSASGATKMPWRKEYNW